MAAPVYKTGPQAKTYLERRLGIEGITQDEWSSDELYEYITEGRDHVLQSFALGAPGVVRTLVTLTDNDDGTFIVPAATEDPLRALELRAVEGKAILTPSTQLDQDAGEYEWTDIRTLTLAEHVSPPGGIEGFFVLAGPAITAATAATFAGWGLRSTLLLAALKYAAVLALTKAEDSDARAAMALFEREIARLELIYSEFDGMGGVGLREAMLSNYGALMGEMIY